MGVASGPQSLFLSEKLGFYSTWPLQYLKCQPRATCHWNILLSHSCWMICENYIRVDVSSRYEKSLEDIPVRSYLYGKFQNPRNPTSYSANSFCCCQFQGNRITKPPRFVSEFTLRLSSTKASFSSGEVSKILEPKNLFPLLTYSGCQLLWIIQEVLSVKLVKHGLPELLTLWPWLQHRADFEFILLMQELQPSLALSVHC